MKKLFATLLALVMMLSVMSVTAFAAPAAKPADLTGHTYEAYQIFSGKQAEDSATLTDIEWGDGVNGTALLTALKADTTIGSVFTSCTDAKSVAKAISDAKWGEDSAEARAFAKLAYANKVAGKGTTCEAGTTTLDAGYYLVVDTTTPSGTDFVSNLALLQLTNKGTFEIQNKVDVPEVEKKIVEGETKVDLNEASIGEVINYEVTGTLPTDLSDYSTYFYQFTDTMSKGLTYNNDMKVTVDGKDLTDYFYKNATTADDGKTTIIVSIQDLLALSNLNGVNITKDSQIVLKYTATLNKDAVVAGNGNPNDVEVKYSNNPSDSGKPTDEPPTPPTTPPTPEHPTGVTPKDEVKTYTTELTIKKIDEKGNILTGAEFQLTGDGVKVMVISADKFVEDTDGAYWKLMDGTYTKTAPVTTGDENDNSDDYASTTTKYTVVNDTKVVTKDGEGTNVKAFVKEDGTLTFTGLGAGTYTLTETTTPAGYNSIAPIEFKVSFDSNTKKFSSTAPITVQADNTLYTEIVNQAGSTLPETGGIGTTIFYAIGGILLVGAAVMLVAKKRMDAED